MKRGEEEGNARTERNVVLAFFSVVASCSNLSTFHFGDKGSQSFGFIATFAVDKLK